MSSQKMLLDVMLALNANKKKERLGALENLIDLLNQEKIIENLHLNSKAKDNSVSWDILFIRVHNAVLSFIDEYNSKNRQVFDKQLQIFQRVILLTVQKSVFQKVLLIDCNLLVSSVLAVFECESRVKFLGSVYANLYCKYVASERKNWCELKGEYWIGLKNLCMKQFKNSPQGTLSILYLEILTDTIRYSSRTCQISQKFLDVFDFIKETFASYQGSGSNFEINLLRLTNTLCLQLAVEFRYKVCEFMEEVFDFVIRFHETKKPDKNILVYHFLMTTLNVHNPNGVWRDKCAYASDFKKWTSQVRKIYFFFQDEIRLILKNPNEVEIETDFLDLYVDVSHLVFMCASENSFEVCDADVVYEEPGPSNKRKCLLGSLTPKSSLGSSSRAKHIKLDYSLENFTKDLLTSDAWFWLKYLELLVQKYPSDLKNQYCQVVEVLYQLICDKRHVQNTKLVLRCLCSLIEIENSCHIHLTRSQVNWLDDMWKKISVELLRSLQGENSSETHSLIRSLIRHSKLCDCEFLIKLYCNGTLSSKLENFKTLSVICQYCVLPEVIVNENRLEPMEENYENVRENLLAWLLRGEETHPCKDLAKVLVALILKRFEEEIENCIAKEDVLISRININDFCKLITTNYMTVAFENLKFVEGSKAVESAYEIRLDNRMKNKLFDLLDVRWKHLIEGLNNETENFDVQLKYLNESLWFCELLCHLISHLESATESIEESIHSLVKKLEALLFGCSTKGLKLIREKFFDLTSFSNLYDGCFHENVQKIIREPTFMNLNFLKYLFEFFASRDEDISSVGDSGNGEEIKSNSRFSQLIKNPQSIFHFQNLTHKEKSVVSAVEILCQYITVPGCREPNRYQSTLAVKIVQNLLSYNFLDASINFHLQLVLRVVYNFTRFDGISVPVLNGCLDLVSSIFNRNRTDFEVIITILQVLKDLTNLVHRVGTPETHSKFLEIIDGFRTLAVSQKNCGVKVVSKFIECLGEISKVDPDGTWAVSDRKGVTFKVFEDVISLLKHPYHEVRLTAAQHVGFLFQCRENTKKSTLMWQKGMLEDLFEVLSNNSSLLPKEKGCVAEYFNSVITSASLISWASVICLSGCWRKKALFYLLRLAFLKNFPKNDVEGILKVICKELKISDVASYIKPSLFYLLYEWAAKNLQLQDFPFYLLKCETIDDFIQNHFRVLVAVYSQIGETEAITAISTTLRMSVEQIIRDCYPGLMSFVLPSMSENAPCEASIKARKLKVFIGQNVSSKTSIHWLTDYLDEVIYNMIRNVHDVPYLKTLFEFYVGVEDDDGPVSFTVAQIVETLENLSTDKDRVLLGKLSLDMPYIIQKILLFLLGDVEQVAIYEDKIVAFYKYIFFVEMMSKVTNKGSEYRDINTFIIRDVVYTLSTITRNDEGRVLSDMACECLKKVLEAYLPEFSGVLGEFLPAITTFLIPLVSKLNQKASDVLGFLICDNYSKLESYIVLLDPFPSDDVFREINEQIERNRVQMRSLQDCIRHFIEAGRSKNSGCRVEGLKNLRRLLSEKKDELKEMYENLKSLRGFSEDCGQSLLHQLVCMLVELASDKNMTVRIEAANCLGELGPSDLTTLVLRPENNLNVFEDHAVDRLLKVSVIVLSDLLISDSYQVKKKSSDALHAVFSTRQGVEIVKSNNDSLKNVECLTPFLSSSGDPLELKIQKNIFLNKFSKIQFWNPDDHDNWVIRVVDGLLESLSDSHDIVNSFRRLTQVNCHFAESIFPAILDLILSMGEKDCNEVVNKNVNEFFERHFNSKSPTSLNKTTVQCMVNVVDYIRIQRNHEEIYQCFGLNVNYLHVAKAALYCSAFFTAIFYAELYFEEKRQKDYDSVDVNTICESFPEEGFALTEILRECHSKIGNSDGIHGCGYMHILDTPSEIQHYEHLKNWSLSMLHHDIQLSQGNKCSEAGLITALERSGMFYTLNNLIKKNRDNSQLLSVQYKCAAKLFDWSLLDSTYRTKNNVTCDAFDKCHYFALKAFHVEDDAAFQNETYKARKSVLNELTNCSLESSKNLYLPLSELQCLKELEEFALVLRNSNETELNDLYTKWKKQDDINCGEFKLIESILTNRIIMIKDRLDRTEDPEVRNTLRVMLCEIYYKLTVAARKERKYETAIRTLSYLNNISEVPKEIAGKMKMEKARILWESGDREIGRFLLSHFLKRNEIAGELKSKSLRIYGDWMAKTKSENSREIIEKYYLNSIDESSDSRTRIDSYASLAKFADSNYEELNEYLSSPLFEIKQNLISTQQDLATELRQELGWNQNREKRMAYQIAAKQSVIDENEIKNYKTKRDCYLNLALRYYLLSVKEGEKYNLLIFRVISLWLSNYTNQNAIQALQKVLHQIPTYKFLCLLPQLIPRMADVCLISSLVEQILQDHPHHTLPLLFALSNSYEDLKYNGVKSVHSTPRVLAAKSMLDKFQKNKKLTRLIVEMEQFSSALIELANYNPADRGRKESAIDFPDHLKIKRVTNLFSVSVPSLHISYDKKGVYDNIIGVYKFEESYHLVGGVNLPKKIKCVGSDGVSRPLLVKGKDDLRQDAVMQQVFTIMNSLLHENTETNRRKLVIRTYKVVPLSQRSGIIEWCENTQPLSLYLTGSDGKSGAHKKFYPDDLVALECRSAIKNVFAQPQVTNDDKLKVFLDVCKNFHPVFHNFFIEKFPAAGVWFERRLAYIHSVATSSMIGYILGIGDRHVHNILIDNSTAEVIHIDLGIAFEQGKTLPTPETVPFRLTRDIVDGMGLSGIEGDFRISCVKTMEVLRENQDTILTLLEVLLYDPLYTWTITPGKAYSMQNHTETSSTATEKSSPDLETNKMAERALIRLRQKLQGTEGGCVASNVEGQVSYLIQQARDPNNLCRLFHGWQAYL